jgi:transcriptional regulator with XRE-family HTH domain
MGFKENLKSELIYSGMPVKELAAKSGVNKYSIDNYLNARGQIPSAEAAVKIAAALGVSVEYLVTGKEAKWIQTENLHSDSVVIARQSEQRSESNRKLVLEFTRWLKSREGTE